MLSYEHTVAALFYLNSGLTCFNFIISLLAAMLGDLQTNEKKPRETILRAEFSNAIQFINKDLSKENRLKFLSYDLQKHSRKYDGFPLIAQIILNFQSFEWLLT